MSATRTTLPAEHCSGCGNAPDRDEDGYTDCCNERACWGDCDDAWNVAPDYDSAPDARPVKACCGAAADIKAKAIARVVLSRRI